MLFSVGQEQGSGVRLSLAGDVYLCEELIDWMQRCFCMQAL